MREKLTKMKLGETRRVKDWCSNKVRTHDFGNSSEGSRSVSIWKGNGKKSRRKCRYFCVSHILSKAEIILSYSESFLLANSSLGFLQSCGILFLLNYISLLVVIESDVFPKMLCTRVIHILSLCCFQGIALIFTAAAAIPVAKQQTQDLDNS